MHHQADLDSQTRAGSFRRTHPAPSHQAKSAAERALQRLLRHPGIAVAVAVVDGEGTRVGTVAAGHGKPLILGRHSECDVRLDEDGIALRQLALMPRPGNAGTRVDVWDLRTDVPLLNARGERISSLSAEGDFVLTFASYTLLVRTPERVLAPLPPPRSRMSRHELLAPSCDGGTITRVTPLGYVGEHAAQSTLIAYLESRCEGFEHVVRLPVASAQLAAGLLIGRYPRCAIQASAADTLSRVHVLIVEIDHEPWVIDLASTNGTERNGSAIDAAPLHRGDRVKCATLKLTWMPAEDAAAPC
jgi:hypothetical protein